MTRDGSQINVDNPFAGPSRHVASDDRRCRALRLSAGARAASTRRSCRRAGRERARFLWPASSGDGCLRTSAPLPARARYAPIALSVKAIAEQYSVVHFHGLEPMLLAVVSRCQGARDLSIRTVAVSGSTASSNVFESLWPAGT